MNGEGMAQVVQTWLVTCAIRSTDHGFLPDALKGRLNNVDVYALTIAFDKEWSVVIL